MDLLGFALAVLVIELTPGPNMAWLAGLAATEGRRSGLAAVAGVGLGLLVNGVLAALGLVALLDAMPALWRGLRLAGALLVAGIAVQTWISSGRAMEEPRSTRWPRRSFAAGLLINLINPKAYLFFAVVVPQFMHGETLHVMDALAFSVISTVIATAIHLAIILAGSRAQSWLIDPSRTKMARRIFALTTFMLAASFLLVDLG